ncbi:MAG: peptide deformylase [delta proteobacterium ML8_F1]|nr:MAG: peptide deformylase [delta proteobacterium ML8_F1]
MALRTIRIDGDPVLRKVAKPVTKFDEKLALVVQDMLDTMVAEDGIGLAAPQIGLLKRIMVIDLYDDTGSKVYVNPEILHQEGEQFEVEGCLSVPDASGAVRRPAVVTLRAQDLQGDFFEVQGEGLLARAMCHEIDHLNGILFTDKIEEKAEEV